MVSKELASAENNEISIRTILLVEDDEAISEFLSRLIEQETPYKALHVTDAAEALQVVASIKPSLLILDYQLPGINGLELFDRLHSIEGLEMVPTIMVSANFPSRKAIQQRQITFIQKPFDLPDLLTAIDELLPEQER
jgi:CheY-like chemotaxis protein